MNETIPNHIKFCSIGGGEYSIIVEFPSRTYITNQVITSVANCILMIPVILLNGITVLTILKSPQLKAKICHFPVLIQSATDMTVGLLTLPLFTFLHLNEVFGSPECLPSIVLSTIAFIPWGLSLASLCALTFERYMGVLHPISRLKHLTKNKFLIYIGCVVLVTFVIVPLAVVSALFYYIYCAVYAIIPMFLHTYCYARILHSARKRLQSNDVPAKTRSRTSSSDTPYHGGRRHSLQSSREIKLAKSCALVVITFYVCCIPGEFLNIFYLEKDVFLYRVVFSWYVTALGVNTILNSVIFFWTRPVLRKEAFKILKKMCKRN